MSVSYRCVAIVLICLTGAPLPGTVTVQSNQARSVGSIGRATYDVSGDVAEIVAATPDGRTLVYTDSGAEELGFVDITDPLAPSEIGTLSVSGEPTSVAITPDGLWALATVNGTPDQLVVVDLADRTVETTIMLGGQPDSIAVSPDGRYAAIAIENERDEVVNEGLLPQEPAGFLTIVDLVSAPSSWTTRDVQLTGLADRFPEDPEPEFVDINGLNVAAVTLQENNHVVIVSLADGSILADWSAGTTTHPADTEDDGDIVFDDTLVNARREPDAIAWTPGRRLITANEGDYDLDLADGEFVGGRDFTVFSALGTVAFEPGASFELQAVRHGHYPDDRSDSKGTEPEGVEVATFQNRTYAFIGSERGDFVAVYDITTERAPRFVQLLPTGDEPEGLLAIPARALFVTANEGDGTITIFSGWPGQGQFSYPEVVSDGTPWSALCGLSPATGNGLFAVPDSAFSPSRIFAMTLVHPAKIQGALTLTKDGAAVSYDLEGIETRADGGWWVVSEGAGSFGQSSATKNLLIRINPDGSVAEEIELPESINQQQRQWGLEGVATSLDGSQVYVAFQREWSDDPIGLVKIGRYTPATGEWRFFHYPLDPAPPGGWVGLSEITRVDDTMFAVIERDNQQRDNAQIKRIYSFSVLGLEPTAAGGALPPVLTKTLLYDIIASDGVLLEKVEGMTRAPSGEVVVVYDNDGAGETRLLRLGDLF
jgi:hypothetical protein